MVKIEVLPPEEPREQKNARPPRIEVVEHREKKRNPLAKIKSVLAEKLKEKREIYRQRRMLERELELFLLSNGVSLRTARNLAKRIVRRGDLTPEQAVQLGMAIDEERMKLLEHRYRAEAVRRRLMLERALMMEDMMSRAALERRLAMMDAWGPPPMPILPPPPQPLPPPTGFFHPPRPRTPPVYREPPVDIWVEEEPRRVPHRYTRKPMPRW